MLDAIDDAVDLLEADRSPAACRGSSFGGGLWAIPIRDRLSEAALSWEPMVARALAVTLLGNRYRGHYDEIRRAATQLLGIRFG